MIKRIPTTPPITPALIARTLMYIGSLANEIKGEDDDVGLLLSEDDGDELMVAEGKTLKVTLGISKVRESVEMGMALPV